ncbi:hypothetical protein EG349_08525 [Chryseobacterium shandongense]|uniref:Type I restriction modification DNA specificity domain-containing protein n=2 Tax=Chryseobacterium shandongense TaxID=1493872 RepID=A0AAD0YDA9_9FLAO|nr:restriction endonuclease subunit S [Chryseobacterium shandongense]AZA86830.1 hypothetical protein EG349_08525 [Chryseobacterium shandongense]
MDNALYDIPDSWKWVTLGDIGIVVSGGTPSTREPEFWNGDIPWITPADLSGYDEIYISEGARKITQIGLDYSSAYLLPENSVVFSSRAPIGYVAITKNKMATNQGFKNLILPSSLINCKYTYYYLKTIKKLAEQKASGTTFLELSAAKFKQIPIPLAPIEEQLRIVEKIDELVSYTNISIVNINQALENANLYLKKSIYQLFRGNLLQNGHRLKILPDGWKWKTLKDVGEIYNGGTPKTSVSEYWNGSIPWITPSDLSNYKEKYISKGQKNITELAIEKSSVKILPKETVLFSTRAPIGYVVIAKNELTTNQGFKSIVPNEKIDSSFLYYFLKSITEYANKIASGTTFLELSTEKFKEIPIPIPPIEEQVKIVVEIEQVLNNTDNLINELTIQKEKIINSKEKILKEAFQGKLTSRVEADTLIDLQLEKIKKQNKEFLMKQEEVLRTQTKTKKNNYDLKEIISTQFDKVFFRFEDLVEMDIFSLAQLSEQWNVLINNGYVKKVYDTENKIIQFKKA